MNNHVIIADDHSMIRKGLKLLLLAQLGCKHIYEVNSCNSLLNELKRGQCTHLILDVIFSDGTAIEIVPIITELYPHVKIMIFSMQLKEVYGNAFKQFNIHHYLHKTSNEEETIQYISSFLYNEPLNTDQLKHGYTTNPFASLAPRELEILHYLLNGYKTNNIAQTLNLSDSTVSTIKKRIFEKTDTYNIAQILELALLYNISY